MSVSILKLLNQLTTVTSELRKLSSTQEIVISKEEIIKLLDYVNANNLDLVQINSQSGAIGSTLIASDPQQKSPSLDITNYDNW